MKAPGAGVVVGVDGSPSSLEAVDVAAREAELRRCELRVVHAFGWPYLEMSFAMSPLVPAEKGLRDLAERTLAGAVLEGEALTVLEAASHEAVLVVVGSRGLGRFAGVLAGSVAIHLAAHGACPVMVVRDRSDAAGPVVLGVDGSPAGAAAVDFAFEAASLRDSGLVALHAWTPWTAEVPPPPDPSMPYAAGPGMLADAEERLLAQVVAGRSDLYQDLDVRRETVRSGAREALIEASGSAGLLVVGARGRGGFRGLLLGSVSQALLSYARCPVVVVRSSRG